jgi:pimeloyl-ACP methyl ester carboxylesterase
VSPCETRGNTRRWCARRPKNLKPLWLGPLVLFGREHGDDRDPLDLEVRVGPHHIARLGPFVQDLSVERAPRLPSAGGPPRPRAVGPRARQLDINPAGHGDPRYNAGKDRRSSKSRPPGAASTLPGVRSEPILLVHGFASSFEQNWREPGWVDLLQEAGRQVIPLDLPGHGRADKPHDPAAYANLSSAVEDALPAAGSGPIDAIGFSLGAQLLLDVASRQPERFGRLVVGGVGANVFSSNDPEPVALAIERGDAGAEDPSVARAFAQFASGPGVDRAALAACLRGSRRRVTAEDLAGLTRPVLVVLGDRDFAGPADPLVDALPDAKLVTLRGADHFGTPKDFRFLDAALEFLDAVPG